MTICHAAACTFVCLQLLQVKQVICCWTHDSVCAVMFPLECQLNVEAVRNVNKTAPINLGEHLTAWFGRETMPQIEASYKTMRTPVSQPQRYVYSRRHIGVIQFIARRMFCTSQSRCAFARTAVSAQRR